MSRRTWIALVAVASAIGLAVRLAAVIGRPDLAPAGDPSEYWLLSNYLAEGKGWIEPIIYRGTGVKVQTAKLPPLYTMLLVPCSLAGFKSFFAHRIWSGVLSAAGVPIAAALGRDVAGRAAGGLTAVGVALYPNIWMPATIGMSETISPIMAMLVLWAGYRLIRDPSPRRALLVGLAVGFAALARDEMLVFAGFILLPAAWGRWRGGRPWRQRLRLFGAGLVGVVVVVMPWVGYNLSRFSHPVLITDRFGVTLASANCPASWYGPFAGYWSMPCAEASVAGIGGDESASQSAATNRALDYVQAHLGSLPRVEYDRLGRTFAFWHVSQQMSLDINVENRPRQWVWVGLWSWYGLLVLAPFGLWRLRRAKVPLYPLAAILADVVIVALIAYGQTRFRVTLEPVMVLLGAVAVAGLWRRPVRPFEGLGLARPLSAGGTDQPAGAWPEERCDPRSADGCGEGPPATSAGAAGRR